MLIGAASQANTRSLQPLLLCSRSLKDGYFGICIFPESQEILIRCAYFCLVALQRVSASDAQMRECSDWLIYYNSEMVMPTCQGRSKIRPLRRSKSRPVDGCEVIEYAWQKG